MQNIKTRGNQLFNIPNNKEGLVFLKSCKKFLNKSKYRFIKRGRGKRDHTKFARGRASLSIEKSEWMAIYVGKRNTNYTR